MLLTEEAWARLRTNMYAAGFPVVEQLGLYKLAAWPVPIWVYQVTIPSLACLMMPLVSLPPTACKFALWRLQ